MNTNNLVDRIYYSYRDIAKVMYAYYENKPYVPEDLDVDKFTEMCGKNLILTNPSIIFDFLERNDVKLTIIPKFATNHQYSVMYMNDFMCGLDCESRKEAEYRAVMTSISLLDKAMKNGKIIKYVKEHK